MFDDIIVVQEVKCLKIDSGALQSICGKLDVLYVGNIGILFNDKGISEIITNKKSIPEMPISIQPSKALDKINQSIQGLLQK